MINFYKSFHIRYKGLIKRVDRIKFFCLDVLFPIICVGCGKEADWVCQLCKATLFPNLFQYCALCGARNLSGETCIACKRSSVLDALFIGFDYNNRLIQQLIINFKYKKAFDIKRIFIDWLIDLLYALLIVDLDLKKLNNIIIIPVPLHRRRLIQRGFNQSELLARGIADHFGMLMGLDVLYRRKNTTPQTELNAEERKNNIQNAFFIKNQFKIINRTIILVDDIFTSGSTMTECAKMLKAGGANAVYGLAVAKG